MDNNINIAICDDDENIMKRIVPVIESVYKEKYAEKGVGISFFYYRDGDKLVDNYIRDNIDVVFMDIELDNNVSGFEVAKRLGTIITDPGIVYMTNYDQYVYESFVCRPLGFIRKKSIEKDIWFAISSVQEYIMKKRRVVVFSDNSKKLAIQIDRVRIIEVYNHEMRLETDDNVISIRDQLSHHIKELQDCGFVTIYRGMMINLRYVADILPYKVKLVNGRSIDISKDRYKSVQNEWMYYKMM